MLMNRYDLKRGVPLILLTALMAFGLLFALSRAWNLRVLSINGNSYFTENARELLLELKEPEELKRLTAAIKSFDTVSIRTQEGFTYWHFKKGAAYGPTIRWLGVTAPSGLLLGERAYENFLAGGEKAVSLEGLGGLTLESLPVGVIISSPLDPKEDSRYMLMDYQGDPRNFSGVWLTEGQDGLAALEVLKEEGAVEIIPIPFTSFDPAGNEFFSIEWLFIVTGAVLLLAALLLASRIWISSYQWEIRVRKLCGASVPVESLRVGVKYLILLIFGTMIGVAGYFLYSYLAFGLNYPWWGWLSVQ